MGYMVQDGDSYASIAAKLGNPRAFLNLMKANGGRVPKAGTVISLEGIDDDDPYISHADMDNVRSWEASNNYRSGPSASQAQIRQGYMDQAAAAGPPAAANIRTSSIMAGTGSGQKTSNPKPSLAQSYMNSVAGTMPSVAKGVYGLPNRTAAGPTQLASQNKYGEPPKIVNQNPITNIHTPNPYNEPLTPKSHQANVYAQRMYGVADSSQRVQQKLAGNIVPGSYMKPVTSFTPQQTQAGVTARWKTYNEVATSAVDFSKSIQSYMDTGDETQLPLVVEYETLWALGLSMTQLEALGYVRLPGNNMRWQRLDSIRAANPGVSYNFGSYGGGYYGGWGGGGGGGGGGTIGGGSGGVGGLINWRIG